MLSAKPLRPAALVLVGSTVLATGAFVAPRLSQAAPTNPAKSAAATAAPAEEGKPADISAVKDAMSIVSDGKGHYVAFGPIEGLNDSLFYGDGKRFWKQRVGSGGSQADIAFWRRFWDPRSKTGEGSDFSFKDRRYFLDCNERKTELKRLSPEETKAMVGSAKFYEPRWKWRAHLAARDDRGNYYYVDREREPSDSKMFRLWVGPKGNLKQQKMTNIVADSEGEIYATKTGSLRLIAGKNEYSWISGTTPTKLTHVPIVQNVALIYNELGVYAGQSLGTPCDDM